MWRASEKILMLGKIESRRRRGWQRVRWLDVITDWMNMSLTKLRVIMKDRKAWQAAVPGVAMSWTWLSDWKTNLREAMELAHGYNSWWVTEHDVSLSISLIPVGVICHCIIYLYHTNSIINTGEKIGLEAFMLTFASECFIIFPMHLVNIIFNWFNVIFTFHNSFQYGYIALTNFKILL